MSNISIKELKTSLDDLVLNTDRTIIVPHDNADYDAVGSAIGLSLIPKRLKKPSYVLVNDSTYKMEYGLQRILEEAKDTTQIINADRYLSLEGAKELVILTDVSNSKLVCVSDEIKDKDKVVIDHHDPTPYLIEGNYNYVDTAASSASEIVTRLLKLYKIKIPANIANYLLAGIYLDTEHFSKMSKSTSEVMTDLFEAGASMDVIKKWFVESFESYRKVQSVVNNVKFYTCKFAISVGDANIEYTRGELAKAADALLKFDVDASFAIGKTGDNIVSISARGNSPVDVGMIMRELDGGGNPRAAAAPKIEGQTLEEVQKSLIKAIRPKYYIKEETN